eukprot:scaffold649466_cov47-Prasinocladus_malaysianus.AAC.1
MPSEPREADSAGKQGPLAGIRNFWEDLKRLGDDDSDDDDDDDEDEIDEADASDGRPGRPRRRSQVSALK